MKCDRPRCENEVVGEARLATKTREWTPRCKQHLEELKTKGIEIRFYPNFEPIKILCHTCVGKIFINEVAYKTRKPVKVICPECEGMGFLEYRKFHDSEKKDL